jgi:hypothetical protein
MTACTIKTSPLVYARVGGALYLVIILFGVFAEGFVTSQLVVAGDAAATAHKILAAPGLWRLGVAGNVVVVLCAVPLLWIEYLLLRPVSKSLALLAALLNVVSLGAEAVSKVFLLLVMPTLTSTGSLDGFNFQQQAALASLALKSHNFAFDIALLFFGFTCLVNGYLIFKSGYIPKPFGLLLQAAGAGYLVACSATLFAPALAAMLLPGILLLPLIGESALCLWLLINGVNCAKWQERTARRRKLRPVFS